MKSQITSFDLLFLIPKIQKIILIKYFLYEIIYFKNLLKIYNYIFIIYLLCNEIKKKNNKKILLIININCNLKYDIFVK